MAVDKNKIIAEATKLVQKGAYEKAIKTYERILAEDPKDVRVLLKVGELYQKKGDDRMAADAFKRVAETYADQGFFLKAVAVYKQIVKLDPEDVRVNERLAALYQQLGLMSDAQAQLQLMAAVHEKAGDNARLLDVLKRMVELDPENIASSIKLGELYQRANQAAPALEHFRRAAEYLKKHNRADEYLRVAERIAALAPEDLALTRELANIYLAKGDTKRALAKLQVCFSKDRKDVETLNMLAQAFHELGQTSKELQVYKELARVHEEKGRAAEAGSIWRKVLELAPDDPDARQAAPRATAAPAASSAPAHAASPAARDPAPGPPPGPGRAHPAPIAPPAPAAPVHAATPEQIPKLLTETDVYLKYGLLDKALDHLRKVLAIDPEWPEAHERAREIHASAGRMAQAVAAAEAAVRGCIAKGLTERAQDDLARLRQLDPGHAGLGELGEALGGRTEEISLGGNDVEEVVETPPLPEVSLEAQPEPLDQPELGAGEPDLPSLELLPREEGDALALAAAAEDAEAELEDEGPAVLEEEGSAVLEDEPMGGAAASPRSEPAFQADADTFSAPSGEDDLLLAAAAAAVEAPEEIVDEPVEPPAPVVIAAPAEVSDVPEAAGEPEADEEEDLSDELDEVDFFLQQGLVDEAREALHNLQAFYPDHAQVKSRLTEVERRAAAAAPPPAPALDLDQAAESPGELGAVHQSPQLVETSALGTPSFDIGKELAEELDHGAPPPPDEFQYSVEDVFNQFKKGVAETVKAEDSDTHYDLGIAYKEMGLLDDAVHEFETAVRGSNRKKEVDGLSMVGLCRMAQGRPREAVEALRRALRSDYLTKEAVRAVQFDLGAAYEATGEVEVALWYLHKVARADPAYRQVGQRITALGGGPGRPPADELPAPRAAGLTGLPPPRPIAPAAPAAAGPKKNIGYL
jgi:tetratricopeptide (TPR) repeat protein